jgi:serine protease AprX
MTVNHGFRSDLAAPDQPFDQVVTLHLDGSRVVAAFVETLGDDAFSDEPFGREKPSEDEFPAQEEPPPNIHPVLARRLEERSPDDRELILVNLRDDMTIPRFPEPVENESGDSRANREVQSRSDALIGQILEHREGGYRALAQEFADRYGAEILQTFWLVRCMLLEVLLGMVRSLAERDDLLYVEPNDAGDIPGQNANPNDDVDDGRGRIVSDPYFNLGLTGGFVGLLDTGLRFTHTLFTSPSHIAFRFDCTGGAGCSTGPGSNPNDDCWNHGTAEAAAFTGNINQGNAFRGVTGITLDSFKVFPTSFNPTTGACNGFLNVAAGVSAFQTAVSVFDRVIYGGMQGSGNYLSSLSIAADNAFDAGAVVIGINGNFGPAAGTVNSPGNAHRVIGVGNFNVQTLAQITSQSRGPTPDGRIKPDIQAPTNTETASNASDTALFTLPAPAAQLRTPLGQRRYCATSS